MDIWFLYLSFGLTDLSLLPLIEMMREICEYVIANLLEVLKSEAQGVAAVSAVEDTLVAYNYLKNLKCVDSNVVVMNGYSAGKITASWVTFLV